MHTQCCVLKIHGDYLDPEIRNSPAELSSYPEVFDNRLDQIFDEFGLIVCGWSAEWDEALKSAIYRASSRRFSTYWMVRGEPTQEARRLIGHRQAQIVQIANADDCFESIQQTVESIETFSRPHPLTIESVVANFKHYLSSPQYKIPLVELVNEVTESVVQTISGDQFSAQGGPTPDREQITARFRLYESACTILLNMAAVAGFWADDDNMFVWERALERLSTTAQTSGNVLWLNLRTYPGTLLLYALGLGAVESGQLHIVNRIFMRTVNREGQSKHIVECLARDRFSQEWQALLEGMERRQVPLSDWLHATLREPLKNVMQDDSRYTLTFDKFELLMALKWTHVASYSNDGVLPSAFLYRSNNRRAILLEMEQSISEQQGGSPYVTCGILGGSPSECLDSIEKFKVQVGHTASRMGIIGW